MRHLSTAGLVVLVLLLTAALIANMPEVRRYLRISSM
jgi:hypothetical protein